MVLTHVGGEGRLQTGFPLLALQGLDEGRLLPTDVGSGPAHHKHVKVVAGPAGVPPDEAVGVGLVDGHLEERRRRGVDTNTPEKSSSTCIRDNRITFRHVFI